MFLDTCIDWTNLYFISNFIFGTELQLQFDYLKGTRKSNIIKLNIINEITYSEIIRK